MLLRIPIEFIIPVETAVGVKKYQDFLGLLARSKNRTKKLFEVSVRADIAKQKELLTKLRSSFLLLYLSGFQTLQTN